LLNRTIIIGACSFLLTATASFAASRVVAGTVYYQGKEPASGAAVQLEDRSTMQIVSRVTDREGHFRFTEVSPDHDYEVTATKKGYWSKSHSVSRFSSRSVETVDLVLKPVKDGN
jgi:hypothetical protein